MTNHRYKYHQNDNSTIVTSILKSIRETLIQELYLWWVILEMIAKIGLFLEKQNGRMFY